MQPVNTDVAMADDSLGGVLQSQLAKAREALTGVEHSLHKLTGPVPPPPPEEGVTAANAADILGHGIKQDPDAPVHLGGASSFDLPGKRNFRALMGNDEGGAGRRNRPISERIGHDGNGEPPFKRRPKPDMAMPEEVKPMLSSSVVKTTNEAKSREEAIRNGEKDQKTNARNRRMFGSLLGTLKQFQREETQLKTKEEQRALIEKKVEEKSKQERERMNQQRRELMLEKRKQQQEIKRIEYKLYRLKEAKAWEESHKCLENFVRTKAIPQIFYLPKVMTDAMVKKLEETKAEIMVTIAEKNKRLEEEFQNIDRQAEARVERQIAIGVDQAWRRGNRRGKRFDEQDDMDDIFADSSSAKLAESVDEIMDAQAKARKDEADMEIDSGLPVQVINNHAKKEPEAEEAAATPEAAPEKPTENNEEKEEETPKVEPSPVQEIEKNDVQMEQNNEDASEKPIDTPVLKDKEKPVKANDKGKKKSRRSSSLSPTSSSSGSTSSDSEVERKRKERKEKKEKARKQRRRKHSRRKSSSSSDSDEEDRKPSRKSPVSVKPEPIAKEEIEDEVNDGGEDV